MYAGLTAQPAAVDFESHIYVFDREESDDE